MSYFQTYEFDCHNGEPYPEQWVATRLTRLIGILNPIRAKWGAPLRVISGYRSPTWNMRVGGAEHSFHMEGLAADIAPVPLRDLPFWGEVDNLHRLVLNMISAGELPELRGLGYYPGKWIHVDARPTAHLIAWSGRAIGDERAA